MPALVVMVALIGAGAFAPRAVAASRGPGSLDPSFGEGGHVFAKTVGETSRSEFGAAAREPDGDLVLELRHQGLGIEPDRQIEMRTPDGALIRSFGSGGRVVVENGSGLATLGDGDILIGADRCDGDQSSVEMLDQSGARVASFGTDGCGAAVDFEAQYIGIDSEGRVLLGGTRTYCPCSKISLPPSETVIARILPDGSRDPSFGTDGVVGTHSTLALDEREGSVPAAVAGTSDGGVLIAAGPGLIRLDASGALDQSYGDGGIAKSSGRPDALTVEPDGSALLLSGGFGGALSAGRFTPDGNLDPSFGEGGAIPLRLRLRSGLEAVVPIPEGGYLVAGQKAPDPRCDRCKSTSFLERVTASGQPDPSYGKNGIATLDLPRPLVPGPFTQRALIVDPDGSALVVGRDHLSDGLAVALTASGAPEQSFGTRGSLIEHRENPVQLEPTGLALTPDDGLTLVSDRFTAPGDVTGFQVKFGADGKQLRRRGGAPAVETLSHGTIVAVARGVAIWEGNEPHTTHALRSAGPDGLPIEDYGRNGNGRVKFPKGFISESIGPTPGGGVLAVGSFEDKVTAAFLVGPNGHPARSFGDDGLATVGFPHALSVAYAGLVEADGNVIVTGQAGGHFVAARFLPDGRLDPRYGHGGRVRVPLRGSTAGGLIARIGGGVVIGALEVENSRYVSTGLVRLDSRGRPVHGFGKHGVVHTVAARHPLALLAGGGRIVLVDNPRFEKGHEGGGVELRSYKPGGSVDRDFGNHGVRFFGAGTDEEHVFTPAAAVQQSDGNVVVAGTARDGVRAKAELLRFLIR